MYHIFLIIQVGELFSMTFKAAHQGKPYIVYASFVYLSVGRQTTKVHTTTPPTYSTLVLVEK